MNQLERGLDNRFFGSNNAPCPADSATGPVKGRNYWHRDNNLYDGANFADNGPPVTGNNLRDADPRLVTIFLAPTEAFAGSGQNTYPDHRVHLRLHHRVRAYFGQRQHLHR